jgi:hypothetical protein
MINDYTHLIYGLVVQTSRVCDNNAYISHLLRKQLHIRKYHREIIILLCISLVWGIVLWNAIKFVYQAVPHYCD